MNTSPTQADKALALLWAFLASCLYLSFLSSFYGYEGLIRAMPIETGRLVHLFAGNYLLYGPLGAFFHFVSRFFGFSTLAVISLQRMDAVIGGLGVGLFFLTLRRLGGDRFSAFIWSGILGTSLGYWLYSTEAENYILSTFLLNLSLYMLIRYRLDQRGSPVLLGAIQGLAVLGHIVNLIFLPVSLWILWKTDRRPRSCLDLIAALAIVVGGAYLLVLVGIQRFSSIHMAWVWFKGSAGTHDYHSLPLIGLSLAKLKQWLATSGHALWSLQPAFAHPPAWKGAWMFVSFARLGWIGVAFVLLMRWRSFSDTAKIVGTACGLWLFTYALVFTSWEPFTLVYRVSDLLPITLLGFLGVQSVPRKAGWALGSVLFISLLVGNLTAEIRPRSFPTNNPHLLRMAFLHEHTGPQAWITADGGLDGVYIPYFAQRRPLLVDLFAPNSRQLAAVIDALLAQHVEIYVTSRILDRPSSDTFFNAYKLAPIGAEVEGFTAYRILPRQKPN